VTSSNAIEHQGLVRVLEFLVKNSIEVGTLITDRYKQIARYSINISTIIVLILISDYIDKLIKKTIQFCSMDDDKPALPIALPPPLASAYEHCNHPDKDTIPLFSRYKH